MFSPLKSQVGFAERNAQASSTSFPAPIGGLNLRDPEASMKPIFARQLENFWPQENSVSVRKGAEWHNEMTPANVLRLMTWSGTTGDKLFAATNSGIYDVTTGTPPVTPVQAITDGRLVSVNFQTSGKSWLLGVNGKDDWVKYDGTTWTTTPSFTVGGGTVLTKDIVYIHNHQRALFFLEKESMSFCYMPPDQIATAVTRFPLGGLFNRGGKLIAIGTWTIDGGEGKDDYAVFLTSKGQMAIYRGTDPNSATDWEMKGVFNVGEPLGQVPFQKFGGDLLVLTTFGLTSVSKMLELGLSDSRATFTNIISRRMQALVQGRESNPDWQIVISPKNGLMMVNVPALEDVDARQLAMNLTTGAWSEFTGWRTVGWGMFKGDLYAGIGDAVGKMWQTGDDFGARIVCYCQCAWTYLSPKARMKKIGVFRFLIRLSGQLQISASIDTDYNTGQDYIPVILSQDALARFDEDNWNEALWSAQPTMQFAWLDIPSPEAYCVAPRLRVFAGDATFEWSAIDYAYTVGDIMG